jgi:cell division protein FtsB
MSYAPSRYQIVQRRTSRRWPLVVALGALWLLSLGAAWIGASARAAPTLAETSQRMRSAERQLAAQEARLRQLSQRETTLLRSDQISRNANGDLQGTLAERDEEIAGLRADVAFYERLVGPTQQRKGLSVFSSQFAPGAGSAWNYQIVLTQNLNRGAISEGRMRFVVEGVRNGRLASLNWNELHQQPSAPGQTYSFRYFQALDGRVMLPRDFTPQRVRVLLDGDGVAVEQAFDWKAGST